MTVTVVVRPGESASEAVERLTRESPQLLETPAGQDLLDQLRRLHQRAWRETRRKPVSG